MIKTTRKSPQATRKTPLKSDKKLAVADKNEKASQMKTDVGKELIKTAQNLEDIHEKIEKSNKPVKGLARHSFNMDSSNGQFNIFESVSKKTNEYTGIHIQGKVIVGSMTAIAVAILVACYFLPPIREAVEEFMQALITTFQEAILEKLNEESFTQKLLKNFFRRN